MKSFLSLLRWNICHRKGGYGVHSPFIYYLITQVIQGKTFDSVFSDIEHQREILLNKKTIESIVTAREVPPPSVGVLLFRLINKLQCMKMIEIGGSTAVMSLYMAFANAKGICYVLEDRRVLTDHIQRFARTRTILHLYFLEEYEEALRNLPAFFRFEKIDNFFKHGCIFVNRLSNGTDTETIFPYLQTCMRSQIVWVVNNIRKDRKMSRLWGKINKEVPIKTTIDLYYFGIALFDENLPQKQYQKSFHYGV